MSRRDAPERAAGRSPRYATASTARPEAAVRVPAVFVLLLIVALSAFALLNWSAIATPAPLSIGFATVQAPLGVILLGALGIMTATFLVVLAWHEAQALVAARRSAKDLHAQRELADRAEASRFTDLRAWLDGELRALNERVGAGAAATERRLDLLEAHVGARLTEVANGLAAHVAEVEDKLDRAIRTTAS
jgi:hypothetical protein